MQYKFYMQNAANRKSKPIQSIHQTYFLDDALHADRLFV